VPILECEKLLRRIGKNFGAAMEDMDDADEPKAPKRGRRTIDNGWLSGNRDALLNMFAFGWPEIGWDLPQAENRDALRMALQPLKDHSNKQYINRLLKETSAEGDEHEIRKKRLALAEAVEQMHGAQSHCSTCISRCRDIEAAVIQATADQSELVLLEFSKRRIECQAAQDRSRGKAEMQLKLENEVVDEEAAYAQDQLLIFISKRKYAFHPLNFANGIAGLPFAIGVSFMGVWQSHARCSKIKSPGWPNYRYGVFKTIESAWEDSSSSTQPIIEVFENKIRGLPRTVVQEHPQMGRLKIDNYVRTFLCENWWHLQRAIKKSLQTKDDPRPPFFIIASNLDKFVAEPKTHADLAVAEAARIRD
jgi:hypothetical protein